MKQCSVCGDVKPLTEYGNHKETRDKLLTYCRDCKNTKQRERRNRVGNGETYKYEKSKPGFLVRTYRNMKSRVSGVQKKKVHLYGGLDILEKSVFYRWSLSDPAFNELFAEWEKSNYSRGITPSIDRRDSSKGYDLANMRWITFLENSLLGARSRRRNKTIIKGKVY